MVRKLLASVATICAAQTASASTIDITYVSAASGYSAATIDAPTVALAGDNTRVLAGGFQMSSDEDGALSSFVAWCLDLGAWLGTKGPHAYKVRETPYENDGQTVDAGAMSRIQSVFSANYNDAVPASTDSSAAFQLALWEALYDTDMNLSSGYFKATADDAHVGGIAAGYLTAAANYAGTNLFDLTFLESQAEPRSQNLVTATELAPVPLPASSLLLLAGMGGLAAMKRRKG